jgi:hypothetical protein
MIFLSLKNYVYLNKSKFKINKIDTKQPKILMKIQSWILDFKNLKKKIRQPKVLRLLSNICDLQKKSMGKPMDLVNYGKSVGYGFSSFVISITVEAPTLVGVLFGNV